jgi:hypothetical protein
VDAGAAGRWRPRSVTNPETITGWVLRRVLPLGDLVMMRRQFLILKKLAVVLGAPLISNPALDKASRSRAIRGSRMEPLAGASNPSRLQGLLRRLLKFAGEPETGPAWCGPSRADEPWRLDARNRTQRVR